MALNLPDPEVAGGARTQRFDPGLLSGTLVSVNPNIQNRQGFAIRLSVDWGCAASFVSSTPGRGEFLQPPVLYGSNKIRRKM